MTITIYRARLTLMEPLYFASREIGVLYETEPLIGNYALAYALELCQAPYFRDGQPRYKSDLSPLNEQQVYVTPATFVLSTLRYSFSQFNGQTDSYYSRFDPNAITTTPTKKGRAANFPQNGRIRMIARESQAHFFLLQKQETSLRLPNYIRLGKFNSKARVEWEQLTVVDQQPQRAEHALDYLINGADLPPQAALRAFSVLNIPPAPLLAHCHLACAFWQCQNSTGDSFFLPDGMRFGVDVIA